MYSSETSPSRASLAAESAAELQLMHTVKTTHYPQNKETIRLSEVNS